MNNRRLKNVSASVHQRLLNIAKDNARPFHEVLQYFAMGRFLYRLCQTPHVDAFVLKGALLFRVWDIPDSRATKDEDADYEGVRIRFRGQLGNARISMQMDVGFGDLIHPGCVQADYPALLDLPAPSLRMYPPETVIAEKAEAMVYLDRLNSRMKDFYDIWRIADP